MSCLFRRKNQEKDNTTSMRNGKILLKKLIKCSDGKRNPIRDFSAKELEIGTDNYDRRQIIAYDRYTLYKGFLQNRPVSVMKFGNYYGKRSCFNNIVFASQMKHKNVLKLIGCCLETEVPTLVFESVEHDTLADRLHRLRPLHSKPLLWAHRLKVASEIANTVTYLHIGFHRPIVFKDVKLSHFFFDEQNVVKLCDFSESKFIPEGETHVTSEMMGERRYYAPEYLITGLCNEKSDVFCFGMLLIELVTANDDFSMHTVRTHIKNNEFDELVDPIIVEDRSCAGKEQQLLAFAQLILKCIEESPVDRPTMVDVAKKLRQMYLAVDVANRVT